MRTLLTLLLLSLLCTGVRAQLAITADLGLVADYCTGTTPDPNVDCIPVPTGNANLSYLPGQDGDLFFTYRLINNSGKIIRRVLATDSRFGEFFPTQFVNIPNGATVPLNVIYDALASPENVNGVVTLTVQYANLTTEQVTGNYRLRVVAPVVDVEFGVARQADVCDNTIAANCGVPYGALNGQTVTVGAKDTFTTRFAWTNAGQSTFDVETVVDQDGFQIASTGFDQEPGQTLISARHWEAPGTPGSYNYSQTLTVTDFAGNTATSTVTYTIVVEAPELETAFSLVRKKDACPGDVVAPECGVANYGNFTINVGATDTVITRFDWENAGLGTFDMSVLVDQDGEQLASTGFNQVTGQRLISAQYIVAPALPGTYNRSQTVTVTDFGGNTATATFNYTIVVEAPELETAFSLVRKKDACPGDVVAPECGVANYGNFTINVGATDTVITRFDWENAGLGTFDMSVLVDQDGEQLASTGFNQVTGQRLISAQYIVAPALPGTYNRSQTVTVTDFGGNTATATFNYTIVVEAPELETAFSLVRKKDACPGDVVAPECGVANYGNFTINVGATDTVITRFDWENAGLGTFDMSVLVDQDGEQLASTGFNQVTGQRLISAQYIVAPAEIGTHVFSQTITVTDFGGNTATATFNYTIIVEAPELETAFSLVRKIDACPGDLSAPLCTTTDYGNRQLTVGAGDTIVTRFDWENAGLGTYDMSELVDQDGEVLASTGFNQVTGQRLISAQFIVAPGEPGIYDWSQTITVTDMGGNTATETIEYEVKVDCRLGDNAPPVALCRDRTYTIVEGETQTINFSAINDGSFDGCSSIRNPELSQSTFTCADEGPNTVTLSLFDNTGNQGECTATVTINVAADVAQPAVGQCVSSNAPVSPGQQWDDVRDDDGKLIAQVIIGNNTDIASVKANISRPGPTTQTTNGKAYLGRRIGLTLLNARGNQVQPNNEPVYVRLYYTEAEAAALMGAEPGSSEATFTVIKTRDDVCGNNYTGTNALEMNASIHTTACGAARYLEFFTGTFSTFYLFATNAILPVEMTRFEARTDDKQRVMLAWATATESGNSHFNVEHSADGRTFRHLGAVAGAGYSSEEQRYEYLHATPVSGQNYYRLRQVDLDGTETLSEVREVTISGLSQLSVFPNPAADRISLRGFTGGTVSVVDLQGRTLLRTTLPEFGSLNISGLPAGVYLLRAGRESIRWVKQ